MRLDDLESKKEKLLEKLGEYPTLAVAFSGGVDSSLLLSAAQLVLGDRVTAMTACSRIHPAGEKELAVAIAGQLGVRLVLFETGELEDPNFTANTPDRCYYCKKKLFEKMGAQARMHGAPILVHGANIDDIGDYRPGLKAAAELGVGSPLVDAGMNKADVRRLAREFGLPNWDRPAMACLATRVPYGTAIDEDLLGRIDAAEQVVRGLGAATCRVRHHGSLARIEVGIADMPKLMADAARRRLTEALIGLGYRHVCLDLEGYVSGKMNRGLNDRKQDGL